MKKFNSYFIIAADHHFLQVKEAITEYQIEDDDFYVIFIQVTDRKWIDKIIDQNGLGNYSVFKNWIFKDLFFKRKVPNNYISFLKSVNNINNLFVSQYSSDYSLLSYNLLKLNRVILMDEGTTSFKIVKSRSIEKKNDFKMILKSIFYGVYLKLPLSVEYFTQYELDTGVSDFVKKYSFQKKNIHFEKKSKNQIILLGSSIVEVGLISEDDYFALLINIKNIFSNCQIDYYAHRKENQKKLDLIIKKNFNVIENSAPFETVYSELKVLPKCICSFYSPVLVNLNRMYSELPELLIFEFNLELLAFNKEVIRDIYEDYKIHDGVKVKKLEI